MVRTPRTTQQLRIQSLVESGYIDRSQQRLGSQVGFFITLFADYSATIVIQIKETLANRPYAMSITILPAKFEDAYDLAACNVDTFQSDPLYQDMFGLSDTATPEEQEGNIEFRKGLFEASLRKPHAHIFKAADDSTNLLVGYAGFVEPENRHEAEETELELGNVPQNLNRQRLKEIGARIKDAQKKGLGDRKDYWCMFALTSCERTANLDC